MILQIKDLFLILIINILQTIYGIEESISMHQNEVKNMKITMVSKIMFSLSIYRLTID